MLYYMISLFTSVMVDIILYKVYKWLDRKWNCQEKCSQRTPKILDRQESGSVMRELL